MGPSQKKREKAISRELQLIRKQYLLNLPELKGAPLPEYTNQEVWQ